MKTLDTQAILQDSIVQAVRDLAVSHQGRAWLVGGAVRDWLLTGALPEDLDFMLIDCRAEVLAKKLADERGGHLVPLDEDFGIHRVVFDGGPVVDLSDALQNDLQTDLARRDLTVNAMAIDLQSGELIDPYMGQLDLKENRIRMVRAENLLDDTLRMLRVFRFAALLHASEIDPATLDVIREHHAKIWESAGERIQYELFRFLSVEKMYPHLETMAETGLLETLLPDLTPMRAIGGSGFHHLGLFDHTMELVQQVEELIDEIPEQARAWVRQPFSPSVTRFGLIKLGCLLHDIGKPSTMGEKDDPVHGKRLTFYQHEEVGEEMAGPLLARLKVSNEVKAFVKKLIRWHLYPCHFGPESPRKSVLRFYRRMGEDTPDVVLLALADRHSACGPWITEAEIAASHGEHLWLLENYFAEEPVLKTPRLLNGHQIMEILGIGPGPKLKEILDALQEAQQLGEITTEDEAATWVRAQFGQE